MARRYYNGAVRNLNTMVESFPSNLVAKQFKFREAAIFRDRGAGRSRRPEDCVFRLARVMRFASGMTERRRLAVPHPRCGRGTPRRWRGRMPDSPLRSAPSTSFAWSPSPSRATGRHGVPALRSPFCSRSFAGLRAATPALAEEAIESFRSDIVVARDGTVHVDGDDPCPCRRQRDPARHLPRHLDNIRGRRAEGASRRLRAPRRDARRPARAASHRAPQRFPAHLHRRGGRVPRYRQLQLRPGLRDRPAGPLVRRKARALLERHRQRLVVSDPAGERQPGAAGRVAPVRLDCLYRRASASAERIAGRRSRRRNPEHFDHAQARAERGADDRRRDSGERGRQASGARRVATSSSTTANGSSASSGS